MKHIYSEMPESLKGTYADYSRDFGFSWKEFVATVPSPLFLVTTYKSNGLPNACMQSWAVSPVLTTERVSMQSWPA